METSRLGRAYTHDLLVGTVRGGGVIYDINLTHTRKALQLTGPLADGVADNSDGSLLAEQSAIVVGAGFGVVTDLQAGPGGLYVTSLTDGALYRITTATTGSMAMPEVAAVPEPGAGFSIVSAALAFALRRRRLPI
jgi:hypothetical protein